MGAERRLTAWLALLDAASYEPVEIALLPAFRRRLRNHVRGMHPILMGRAVPEAFAWDPIGVADAIKQVRPVAVVCISGRAFHPLMSAAGSPVILDFVDRLSVSYRDRGRIATGMMQRTAWRVLAIAAKRFEKRQCSVAARVAAGWADATALDAAWIPITSLRTSPARGGPTADVVFVGTLSYPPNVAAVRRLDRIWPRLLARRPQTSLLVAGRNPTEEVLDIVARNGWALRRDFEDFAEIASAALIAVAPLEYTAGIQIKVLDAAAAGLAQVVTPQALEGFEPGFPVVVAESDDDIVRSLLRLLASPEEARSLAREACEHVRLRYSINAWAPRARELVESLAQRPVTLTE